MLFSIHLKYFYFISNIFYSFFQSHIGEIIVTLNREFGIEEMLLWKIVKNKCSDTFNELKKEPDFKEQI